MCQGMHKSSVGEVEDPDRDEVDRCIYISIIASPVRIFCWRSWLAYAMSLHRLAGLGGWLDRGRLGV